MLFLILEWVEFSIGEVVARLRQSYPATLKNYAEVSAALRGEFLMLSVEFVRKVLCDAN